MEKDTLERVKKEGESKENKKRRKRKDADDKKGIEKRKTRYGR